MSKIVPFDYNQHNIRVVMRHGEPWFVLSDVCKVLEIGNPSMAAGRLDNGEKYTLDTIEGAKINGLGGYGNSSVSIISESGLYSLIMTSRKPEAKRFKKWVTAEVLPAIRKSGAYTATPPQDRRLSDAVALRAALLAYGEGVAVPGAECDVRQSRTVTLGSTADTAR